MNHIKFDIIINTIDPLSCFECKFLTKVTIPSSVTSISDGVFTNCSLLKHIIIPLSVTSFGKDCFCCCISLKQIKISSSVTNSTRVKDINRISSLIFYNSIHIFAGIIL